MRRAPTLLLAGLAAACSAQPQTWEGSQIASPELIAREISPDLVQNADPALGVPYIPPPQHLRPCCAFGSGLGVSLGALPLPGVEIANTIGLEQLGLHKYDNGAVAFESSRPGSTPFNLEENGLVYTCRGGFIDTAHVRDWADWTLFLSTRLLRMIDTGGIIELPDEGGTRRIVVEPTDPQLLAEYGRVRATVPLAQWLAFQLSVWHEIATWYGWAALELISEKASSFSPEDLYSNLLGIKLAGILVYDNAVGSEVLYNEAMNNALPRLLLALGAVPADVAKVAARSVDGKWWDSKVKLPNENLVTRRNMDIATTIAPWLVTSATPAAPVDPELVERCGARVKPIALRNPSSLGGIAFDKRATLEIEVQPELAARMGLPSPRITQDDFRALIRRVGDEARTEFGAHFDRP